ncbi:aldehyde dehydrogenase [Achromobacter aloeverae]
MNPPSDRSFTVPHPDRFYIGGSWVQPATAETFSVINCATEQEVVRVAKAVEADVDAAVKAARVAFDHGPWPRMTPQERAVYLRKIAEKIQAVEDDFARIWTTETGTLYSGAKGFIGPLMQATFTAYADMASTFPFLRPARSQAGKQAYVAQEPVGVVVAILPWNGPAYLLPYKVAPALLAGCTVIIKSSPEAPCSGHLFARICEEIGLPPGVVNVVTADRDVSDALVRNPGVDKITFTGSTAAGRVIGAAAAQRIARVTLELGGKSPALVLDDYDIESAAQVLGRPFFSNNTGQVCFSLTRIIVPRARHDAMVEALSAAARGMVVGDPFDPETTMGPLTTARQRQNVERMVAQGVADGATLAAGGARPRHLERGFFYEPTVLGHVDNRSAIAQEEIFGPVLSVIAADSEEQMVAMANDSIYGLNATVFTHDADRAMRIARQLRTGTVGHNACCPDFTIAFGGFKQSGIGREGGAPGLEPFLESKTIVMDQFIAA